MSDSLRYPLNLCPENNELDTIICIAEDSVQEVVYGWLALNFQLYK